MLWSRLAEEIMSWQVPVIRAITTGCHLVTMAVQSCLDGCRNWQPSRQVQEEPSWSSLGNVSRCCLSRGRTGLLSMLTGFVAGNKSQTGRLEGWDGSISSSKGLALLRVVPGYLWDQREVWNIVRQSSGGMSVLGASLHTL